MEGLNRNWNTKINNIPAQSRNQQLPLREGQILLGKIKKLFPNQQAEVLLAGKTIIAQLQTALNLNEKYWFKVLSTSGLPHLKVLVNEQLTKENQMNVLLKGLGLALTENHRKQLSSLINDKNILDQSMIRQLSELLIEVDDVPVSPKVIDSLVKHGLPISYPVYQAVYTKETSDLTSQLAGLIKTMEGMDSLSQTESALMNRLITFSRKPVEANVIQKSSFMEMLLQNSKLFNEKVYYLLQRASIIPTSMPITDWSNALEQLHSIAHTKDIELTLDNTNSRVEINQQSPALQQLIDTFGPKQTIGIIKELKQLLIESMPVELEKTLIDVLVKFDQIDIHDKESIKDNFLINLKQYLLFSGMDNENQNAIMPTIKELRTLKSLILQLSNSDIPFGGQLEKLLHTVDGIQLTSYLEKDLFTEVSFQIPGNRLGVLEDIKLSVKGRKNKSGEIDADFCHIYFFLTLQNIGETSIDMRIQKRYVDLIIHNDYSSIDKVLHKFKPLLKDALGKLDYHLSSVRLKAYGEKSNNTNQYEMRGVKQGVDFKI